MSMHDEPFDHAARLIADIGRCYGRARRYRAIATACEERFLARALAIGSVLRERARLSDADPRGVDDAVRELTRLVGECESAISDVRESPPYRAARCAWDERRLFDVAAYAPALFDAVVADMTPCALYFPITVTAGRGGGDHFVAASALAARVVGFLHNGIPASDPPPELGADEHIGAVVLDDDAEAIGSPITLTFDAGSLELPRFRLEPAGEVLIYTPLLRVRTRVRFAAQVHDEWWAVTPDAYERYTAALADELAARGVTDLDRG